MTRPDGRKVGTRLRIPSHTIDLLAPMAAAEGVTLTQKLVNLVDEAHARAVSSVEAAR